MKTNFGILVMLVLVLFIAGCASSAEAEIPVQTDVSVESDSEQAAVENDAGAKDAPQPGVDPPGSKDETNNPDTGEEQRERPQTSQLALGTIALEQTDQAVDSVQAAALLPLWKGLRSLSESETAASAEIEALTTQIQNSMSPEQLSLINEMDISFQEMGTMMTDMGIELGLGNFGERDPEMQATMQAARESGQAPEGGFGGGPGGGPGGGLGRGPGGGQELSPEARETAIAERGGVPGANLGINPGLLEAVITYLESKTG